MAEDSAEYVFEKALLAVLPLFTINLSSRTPVISGAEIDNRTRKQLTFTANFLAEVQILTRTLEHVVESRNRKDKALDTKSDDYIENLGKALALFDSLVSDEVPGRTFESNFKLGDQEYLKLYALWQLLSARDDCDSLADYEFLILIATREKKHDKILAKISKYNRRLGRLLNNVNTTKENTHETEEVELKPLYEVHCAEELSPDAPKTRTLNPPYEVRQIVNKLYDNLVASWLKTCASSHEAKLRLATFRSVESGRHNTEDRDTSRNFDLLFSTHDCPSRWKQSRISITDVETVTSRVKWATAQPKARRGPLKLASPQYFESVCAVLNTSGGDKSFLHFRAADQGMWKLPPSSKLDSLPVSERVPTVSLKTLIASAAKFNVRQRRVLAVILAYSLLYLSESKWLGREWTKEDICFLQSADSKVDIGRPYLSTRFPGPVEQEGVFQGDNDASGGCYHLAPSLLGFGILLIELEFGKTIESLWTDEDLIDGTKNPNTNRTAAKRFLETAREWDDVYQKFRSAVSACITGSFLNPEEITDDLSFQKAIYNNVVVNLEQELFFGYGLKADTLDDCPYNPSFIYQGGHADTSSAVPIRARPDNFPLAESDFQLLWLNHLEIRDESDDEYNNRIFDSQTLCVPLTSTSPRKSTLAQIFFKNLRDVRKLLDSGRMANFPVVKVAILDTGINEGHSLRKLLGGYYDFVDKDFVVDETPAVDTTGHGSDMVYLLNKTAPYVKIFVARVFSRNTGDHNTALCVAKAIEHAKCTWGVDIISMSFGFKSEHPSLVKAIEDTDGVLMFAASSNFGATEDPPIRFPARMRHKVICINSSDGLGHPCDLSTPYDATRDNFSILGEDVPLGKKGEPGSEEVIYGTGTSIATPIAAGVAALVLEFAMQDGVHQKVKDIDSLKSCTGMSSVLRRMTSKGQKNGFNFIAPGKMLLGDLARSDSERMDEVCRAISKALRTKHH